MKESIKLKWNKLSQNTIKKLYKFLPNRMYDRMIEVIENKICYTPY